MANPIIDVKNDYHREVVLMAMAAADSQKDAIKYLRAEHGLAATDKMLNWIAYHHREQYEELRQKLAPVREQTLTHDLLDDALYLSSVIDVSMRQLKQRLEEDKIPPEYLSRVVRDLKDAQAKSIDKKHALEGKPQIITETRNVTEMVRALEAMGVFKKPEVIEIEQGDG